MTAAKAKPVPAESTDEDGAQNAARFEAALKRVLTVSKKELVEREAAYKKSRRTKKRRAASPSAR